MNFAKKTFFIISLLLCTSQVFGQFGGDDEEDPDEGIPIDGGISLLAASGLAYGIYRYSKKQ